MSITQDGYKVSAQETGGRSNPIRSCAFIGGKGCTVTNLNGSGCKKKQKNGNCRCLIQMT